MANPLANLTPEQQARLAALLGTFDQENTPTKPKTVDELLDEVEEELAAIGRGNLPFDARVAAHLLTAVRVLRPKKSDNGE